MTNILQKVEINHNPPQNMPDIKTRLTPAERERLHGMIREYNRAMVDQNKCFSRRQLKSMDLIDMRNLLMEKGQTLKPYEMPSVDRTEKEIQYIRQNYWFGCIPCFETGVIQVNSACYLFYKILEINVEEYNYTVHIESYTYTEAGWEPGIGVNCRYIFDTRPEETRCSIKSTIEASTGYADRYRTIDPESIGWNKNEIRIWNEFLTSISDLNERLEHEKRHLGESVATIFINLIPKINAALNTERPKTEPKGTKQTSTKKNTEIKEEYNAPKKRVRIVGSIRIKSEKTPKEPKLKNVVHYKTAAWKTRGHVRTYKNGKTVYIRETVHRRKCMEDTDVPQTVIRFRKDMEH